MGEEYTRRVYLLSPRLLSPETIAVAFAKTSRSPLPFDEIADELTDEKSARFHEKWVVGYGHASVAEHAVLHIAIENVSRLAVECIESNRLASYTEKSTRYQHWGSGCYHVPQELRGSPHAHFFRDTCDLLFQAYQASLGPVKQKVMAEAPRRRGEGEEGYEARIRSRYVDACRFLLPAASLANVGMTVNARALEHAIRKMLSHPLDEVRQIGSQVMSVAQDEVPTLVKHVARLPYLEQTEASLAQIAGSWPPQSEGETLSLLAYDAAAEDRVLAAALYAHAGCSFKDALSRVQKMTHPERQNLAQEMLGRLDRFDIPLRALEHALYTFEARLDQGAYVELKRHRMMTQTAQRLSTDLGFAVPRLISEAGFEPRYREVMQRAAEAYRRLAAWNRDVASYVVPNGFNRHVLMTLNLRQAYHLCELRAAPNAHFSMRRLALQMAEKLQQVHPTLASFMRLPESTDWRQIEAQHFTQV